MDENGRDDSRDTTLILVASAAAVLLLLAVAAFGLTRAGRLSSSASPSSQRGLGAAQQTSCLANVKQLDLAALMYCQDYNATWVMSHNWCDAIYPYIKNQSVYVCPTVPQMPCGYACNAHLNGVLLKKLTRPSETVAFYDALGGWNLSGDLSLVDPRHNGGANVGYVDGHAKWVTATGLSSLLWDPLGTTGTGATGSTGAPTP